MKTVVNKKLYEQSKQNVILLFVCTMVVLIALFFIVQWSTQEALKAALSNWNFTW